MDLVLWRHADAEEGRDDLARALTTRGKRQAERMAEWLRRHLSDDWTVLASPARRARETADALSRHVTTHPGLAPGAAPADVLRIAGWPSARRPVMIVGHQPTLGAAAALALTGLESPWRVKKGAVWWLRAGKDGLVVVAVMAPELL
jgi:phosphohistidine phosphatase